MQNKVIRLDPAVFRGMGTLIRQPAHLHPSLWRLDANGMNAVASLLSNAVPVGILREPRLVFGGGRLWFSDLKEKEVWGWVQGRWVSQGNPLRREVTP